MKMSSRFFCFLTLYYVLFNYCSLPVVATKRFLCGPFYDDTTHKAIKSVQNDKRLIVLNLGNETVSFNVAHEICRKCIDGHLVMKEDVEKLIDFLPTWVGIQSRLSHWNNALEWVWADGAPVTEEFFGNAKKFYVPKQQPNETTHYGVYAIKSRNYFTFDTVMDWIAVPSNDPGYKVKEEHLEYEENSNNKTSPVNNDRNYFVVCERPIRSDCHYWNFTEEACINDKKYGCHNYISFMFQHPDGFDEKDRIKAICPPPKRRRQALRCPASSCSCPATPWNQWSTCGSEMCTDEPSFRTRIREQIPHCPESYDQPKLTQTEQCKIHGCDELLGPDETHTTIRPSSKPPAKPTVAATTTTKPTLVTTEAQVATVEDDGPANESQPS